MSKAIDAVLAARALNSKLALNLDAIRNIENSAAHPSKDSNTGEIVPVEIDEAELNLDVLGELFDFYCVLPSRAQQKR